MILISLIKQIAGDKMSSINRVPAKYSLLRVRIIMLFIFTFLFLSSLFGQEDKTRMGKEYINDDYNFIAVNNILMWVSNNGKGSHDITTGGNGFYWPGGKNAAASAIFMDGLVFAGKVNNEVRAGGSAFRSGLQAGKIIQGLPENPADGKNRIYKITKDWESLPPGSERNARERDYLAWPVNDGAPYEEVDQVVQPRFIGDETLWYVSNDMDTARAFYFLETLPLGIEIQTTVYGFKRYSTLGDVVYKKYKIINGGINEIKDMYAGFFSDPDLGDAGDDYAGCDSLLSLGYAWNSSNYDGVYGSKPPAVGYTLVQGPVIPAGISDSAFFDGRWIKGYKNLNMTAFTNLLKQRSSTDLDMFQYAGHLYNFLQGKGGTGNQIINPVTGQLTSYVTSGDPAAGTGWYEGTGWPQGPPRGDRRMMLSSGPFNLSPGDTQEVVFAIHIARGRDNINSITELKNHSRIVKLLYDSGYNYFTYPEVPLLRGAESENSVTLWWGDDAEQYIFEDPVLGDTLRFSINNSEFEIPVSNKNYRFEGYRLWQYRDISGKDPLLLEVSDIKNNIKNIYSYPLNLVDLNKVDIPAETIISSPDEGLKYYLKVTKNAYTGTPLLNGKEYYFGITAYAYSEFSEPPVLESRPRIIKVIPGANAVNADIPDPAGSRINFEHISGAGDAEVFANIIDINFLREHEYELSFADTSFFYSNYNLTDITDGRTLITGGINLSSDSLFREITDGFMLVVNDLGRYNIERFNKIKAVEETKGPGGINIEPRNVFSSPTDTNMNSTGEWTVNTPNAMKDIYLNMLLVWSDLNDYEIRFTETGSEFYVPLNSKGEGKVPFEVWSIPSDTTKPSERLVIKILDMDGDNKWTISSDNKYEKFDTFIPGIGYPEIFPPNLNLPSGSKRVGNIIINGKLPASGTVITIRTWKHLSSIDRFRKVMEVPYYSNETARLNLNDITIFPNPYYSIKAKVEDYPPFIRFTRLPPRLTIRIFSLAGVYITKIEKDDEGQYADWDLKNKDGEIVGSGIYLAYIELPGIGTKVMKIAVMK